MACDCCVDAGEPDACSGEGRCCGEFDCDCDLDMDDDEFWGTGRGEDFADPGGNSALRAASETNPRNLPCPTCHEPNRLTPVDENLGYQCDECADRDECGW